MFSFQQYRRNTWQILLFQSIVLSQVQRDRYRVWAISDALVFIYECVAKVAGVRTAFSLHAVRSWTDVKCASFESPAASTKEPKRS